MRRNFDSWTFLVQCRPKIIELGDQTCLCLNTGFLDARHPDTPDSSVGGVFLLIRFPPYPPDSSRAVLPPLGHIPEVHHVNLTTDQHVNAPCIEKQVNRPFSISNIFSGPKFTKIKSRLPVGNTKIKVMMKWNKKYCESWLFQRKLKKSYFGLDNYLICRLPWTSSPSLGCSVLQIAPNPCHSPPGNTKTHLERHCWRSFWCC